MVTEIQGQLMLGKNMATALKNKSKVHWGDLTALALSLAHFFLLSRAAFVATANYSELFTGSVDQPIIVRTFFDLVAGKLPAYMPYGLALNSLLWFLSLPVVTLSSLVGFAPSFQVYVISLRLAQIAMASSSIFFIYQITRRHSNAIAGLGASLLVFSSYALTYWSLILKPDVWMLFFVLACLLCVDKAMDAIARNRVTDAYKFFTTSCLLWGFGIGSKIWAIFLGPTILLAGVSLYFLSRPYFKNGFRALYLFVPALVGFALAIFISMPHFFFWSKSILAIFQTVDSNYNTLPLFTAFGALLPQKTYLLTSPQFGGPWLFLGFVAAIPIFVAKIFRHRPRLIDLWLDYPLGVMLYLGTFLAFIFFVYRDTFNILGGERNVLTIVLLFSIPTSVGLYKMWKASKFSRAISMFCILCLSFLVFVQAGLGITLTWQPYPRVLHHDTFKQIVKKFSPADGEFYSRIYSNKVDAHQHLLELPESAADRQRLSDLNRQLGLEEHMSFVKNSSFIFWKATDDYRESYNSSEYQVRSWVQKNVRPGTTLLVEFYINLLQNQCYAPMDDLPQGIRIVTVSSLKMLVTLEEIEKYEPDYAFTRYKMVAEDIPQKNSHYKLVQKLGDSLYILAKDVP